MAPLDSVTDAMSNLLGQETRNRPGRKHVLDEAYFARIDAIQFTIAHDDGVGWENWEEADIVLAGVSRTSKTPTSIYLANRGYKAANIPLVPESPPPESLFHLKHPMVVGLTTSPERLVQVRRNRLLSLNQTPETAYVDLEKVNSEVAHARRLFADNDWPVIDVTRRSIEETAAAIINLYLGPDQGRGLSRAADPGMSMKLLLASQSESRARLLRDATVPFEVVRAPVDEESAKESLAAEGIGPRNLADALAELKAISASMRHPQALVLGCDQTLELADGSRVDKVATRADAAALLARMSGQPHKLHCAVVIAQGGSPVWRHLESVTLHVRPLGAAFIESYLDLGLGRVSLVRRLLPDRRAGGAAVQPHQR